MVLLSSNNKQQSICYCGDDCWDDQYLFHVVTYYSIRLNDWPAVEEIEENETRTESYEYVPITHGW